MAKKKSVYREVQYAVGMRVNRDEGEIVFFPIVLIDGKSAGRSSESSEWMASLDDVQEMSLAFGGTQAWCDQLNAELQRKGLNRLREVS